MGIIYEEKSRQFHLYNDKISYIMTCLPNGQMGQLYYGNGCGTGRASAICWSLRTGIWRPVSMRMTPHFHWSISDRNTRPLEPGICGIRLMESDGKMEAGSVCLYTKPHHPRGKTGIAGSACCLCGAG